MNNNKKLIPIYTTCGDVGGFLKYPYIFNPMGEWIGWVTAERTVFSVHGHYAGIMTDDPRILRKREWGHSNPRRDPPHPPEPVRIPAQSPLPPQMAEVPLNMIDVFDEAPELLPPVDWGDLREDMD